jgi:hypothetical protein
VEDACIDFVTAFLVAAVFLAFAPSAFLPNTK